MTTRRADIFLMGRGRSPPRNVPSLGGGQYTQSLPLYAEAIMTVGKGGVTAHELLDHNFGGRLGQKS